MADLEPEEAGPADFNLERLPDGSTLVTVRGELDISSADQLHAAVGPVIERHPERLIVDAKELQFADTSAIAVWVRWSEIVRELEIRNPPPLLRRVIETMGLSNTLPIKP